jgi:hypothetical protein
MYHKCLPTKDFTHGKRLVAYFGSYSLTCIPRSTDVTCWPVIKNVVQRVYFMIKRIFRGYGLAYFFLKRQYGPYPFWLLS